MERRSQKQLGAARELVIDARNTDERRGTCDRDAAAH
jgi:hypothetical protein